MNGDRLITAFVIAFMGNVVAFGMVAFMIAFMTSVEIAAEATGLVLYFALLTWVIYNRMGKIK